MTHVVSLLFLSVLFLTRSAPSHAALDVSYNSLGPLLARAIQLLGTKKTLIVFGTEGLDEMSVGARPFGGQ